MSSINIPGCSPVPPYAKDKLCFNCMFNISFLLNNEGDLTGKVYYAHKVGDDGKDGVIDIPKGSCANRSLW